MYGLSVTCDECSDQFESEPSTCRGCGGCSAANVRTDSRRSNTCLIPTAITWLAISFLGQACLSARVLVQWIASKRAGRSIVPMAFWFLSFGGGLTLLAYPDPPSPPGVHHRTGHASNCLQVESDADSAGAKTTVAD